MRTTTATTLHSLLALFVAVPLSAGVLLRVETTESDGSSEASIMAIDGRRLRLDSMSAPDAEPKTTVIFRGDRGELLSVDHGQKAYTRIDKETVDRLAGSIGQMMKQLEEQMAQLPPEQRAMMERMMKQQMPQAQQAAPPLEISRSGERRTLHGYPCVKYVVSRGSDPVRVLWVTNWGHLDLAAETFDVMADLSAFWRELLQAFESSPQLKGAARWMDNPFEEFDKLDGFPVVVQELEGGSVSRETVLKEVKGQELDPSTFAAPAGYKERALPQM